MERSATDLLVMQPAALPAGYFVAASMPCRSRSDTPFGRTDGRTDGGRAARVYVHFSLRVALVGEVSGAPPSLLPSLLAATKPALHPSFLPSFFNCTTTCWSQGLPSCKSYKASLLSATFRFDVLIIYRATTVVSRFRVAAIGSLQSALLFLQVKNGGHRRVASSALDGLTAYGLVGRADGANESERAANERTDQDKAIEENCEQN